MRRFRLLAVLTAALPTGCTALVASIGTDTSRFDTREQVRAEFGVPDLVGETNGQPYDQFHSRRMIADQLHASHEVMASGMTLGLYEFVGLPNELVLVGGRLWAGQELRFEYDESGRVVRVLRDGCPPEVDPRRQN
jgi:hypothetical protein